MDLGPTSSTSCRGSWKEATILKHGNVYQATQMTPHLVETSVAERGFWAEIFSRRNLGYWEMDLTSISGTFE